MSEIRDKFKKETGENCKIQVSHDTENKSSVVVKMFNHRYVDWLERKLTNEQSTNKSNCILQLDIDSVCPYCGHNSVLKSKTGNMCKNCNKGW